MRRQIETKRLLPVGVLFLAILLGTLLGNQFINLSAANPYSKPLNYGGEKASGSDVKPLVITIISPQNRAYITNNISLNLNVSTKVSQPSIENHFNPALIIHEIYYVADWQGNKTLIYRAPTTRKLFDKTAEYYFKGNSYESFRDMPEIDFENLSIDLTNVPDGNHSITVCAIGKGLDYDVLNWYDFYVKGLSYVNFFVDTTRPSILDLSVENKTYASSEIPLNFIVNKPVSQLLYALDTQRNMTLSGNATLTGLANGLHNITVYAWDNVGNVVSQTLFFTVQVPEPFPTALAVAVIGISAAVLEGIGLVYLVKVKKPKERPN